LTFLLYSTNSPLLLLPSPSIKSTNPITNTLRSDLAKFIAADRIPCTIDRVTGKGIIETNRPDDKNKQYNDVVKQGDQLITKLQKYGQAVRLRGSERA
jgi:26S proteasome regulatory subunit N7